MISSDVIKAQLNKTLAGTDFKDLGSKYKGKPFATATRAANSHREGFHHRSLKKRLS